MKELHKTGLLQLFFKITSKAFIAKLAEFSPRLISVLDTVPSPTPPPLLHSSPSPPIKRESKPAMREVSETVSRVNFKDYPSRGC
jgi:hypothetical protein